VLAKLNETNPKARGIGRIAEYKAALRELGMKDAKDINILARWYHAMYTDKGPPLKTLLPIAKELDVFIPTGRGRNTVRDLLRDKLMLESYL
jgi:hypothetical protein